MGTWTAKRMAAKGFSLIELLVVLLIFAILIAIAVPSLIASQPERNLAEITTRHVASVVYEYQPGVLAKEADRLENPFGFVVTAYRSDPEINTVQAGAKR